MRLLNLNWTRALPYVVVLTVLFLALQGCATGKVSNAYHGILTANTSYEGAMRTFAKLYAGGELTKTQKAAAVTLGHAYLASKNNAVDTVAAYKLDTSTANKAVMNEALKQMQIDLGVLIAYLATIMGGVI